MFFSLNYAIVSLPRACTIKKENRISSLRSVSLFLRESSLNSARFCMGLTYKVLIEVSITGAEVLFDPNRASFVLAWRVLEKYNNRVFEHSDVFTHWNNSAPREHIDQTNKSRFWTLFLRAILVISSLYCWTVKRSESLYNTSTILNDF